MIPKQQVLLLGIVKLLIEIEIGMEIEVTLRPHCFDQVAM
jgi:hypothetical protein